MQNTADKETQQSSCYGLGKYGTIAYFAYSAIKGRAFKASIIASRWTKWTSAKTQGS